MVLGITPRRIAMATVMTAISLVILALVARVTGFDVRKIGG